MKLHTFLNYGGNCEQAFRFYERHLGGKITLMMTRDELPNRDEIPPDQRKTIVHARLMIGGTELMAADVVSGHFQSMRSVYLSLTIDSIEEAERIYALLAEEGEIFMPIQETFYASRFAMLRDRFGTSWMILHERPTQPGA